MPDSTEKKPETFLQLLLASIKGITNLHDDTHIEATITTIKNDIEFRGTNVWILFFAVIVASIGLNINSTAVIIGAMLISPLMGPINGIGLAIGINDNELLRSSLRNFTIMVVIGLLASTIYFLVTPISDAQSELLARTTPTIFDVLIAFFGGLAGVVAASRKEKKFIIISGVAIATALMPPLCTAGFGLATGHLSFFLGAFYLFFINSFFIALATFLMVRYLHFPAKEYTDPSRKRIVKRTITAFTILVTIPSLFIAWNLINETRFNSRAINYIQSVQDEGLFDDVEIINSKRVYSYKEKSISLSLIGRPLTQVQIERLEKKLHDFKLENTKLSIKQTNGSLDLGAQTGMIGKLLDKKDLEIQSRDSVIRRMKEDFSKLKKTDFNELQLAKELKVQYPEITQFALSKSVYTNTKTLRKDTVPTFFVEWSRKQPNEQIRKLREWLKVRLGLKTLKIIESN